MKLRSFLALLTAAATPATLCLAAETSATSPAAGALKNLARQHLGTNLFAYDQASQTYVPTEAAAAWLDDDVTTAWPPQSGKSYYMLTLPEAQLMTNFQISAKDPEGTVSIYAGDEPAKPGAESWKPVARDISLGSVNEAALKNSFSRFAKYLLIETNNENPQPWYSLYVYGNRDAHSYSMEKRGEKIDANDAFGPYLNDQTAFNYSSLYARSEVVAPASSTGSNAAIDDNPATGVTLDGGDSAAIVINYGEARSVDRIAVLADGSAKGRMDFYLPEISEGAESSELTADASPVATLVFDGTSDRSSMEFPAVKSSRLMVRWTPEEGSQPIEVREINSFGSTSVETYAVNGAAEAIGEQTGEGDVVYNDSYDGDGKETLAYDGDGKEMLDYDGDGKKTVQEPIGEFLPSKAPFVPGNLGFPPNLPPTEIPRSN